MPSSPPTCPSCASGFEPAAAACPTCGYSAVVCLRRIPYPTPAWERFIDPGTRLDQAARRKLTRAVRAVESRFPQVEVVMAVADLPAGVETREFGFWLFNGATPRSESEHLRRPHAVLLVIDVARRRAALVLGYGWERWLSLTAQEEILVAGVAQWALGEWGGGLVLAIEALEQELVLAHRYATHHAGAAERRTIRPLPHRELA